MKNYKLDVSFDMKEALKKFNKNYEFIYDHEENDVFVRNLSRIAALDYDDTMKQNGMFKKFVCDFVKSRGDYLTSDRECAAIVITFIDMMMEQL